MRLFFGKVGDGRSARKLKPSASASKDATRPLLQAAFLDIEGKLPIMVTTDSYSFVKVPVSMVPPNSDDPHAAVDPIPVGWIGPEALRELEKAGPSSPANVTPTTVERRPYVVERGEYDPPEGRWPKKWRTLWPKKPRRRVLVGVNAKFLKNVGAALGEDTLVLEIDLDEMTPISVPYGSEEEFDYQKPIRIIPASSFKRRGDQRGGLQMPFRLGNVEEET